MKKLFSQLFFVLLAVSIPFSTTLFAQTGILTYDELNLDPCQVFIGVYTTPTAEGGVRIVNVVDKSPASNMDLKNDDIIFELDGEEINSPCELIMERDRNKPGDYFRLTVMRDGKTKKVRGQFTACIDDFEVAESYDSKITIPSSELKYQSFEAYPNPTFGEVNIAFEGEAVPTIIRVTDITGKVVFAEELKNFNGFYRKQIQIQNNATPGAVSLTIIQNEQAVSKNIVLLNRN